MSEFEKIKLITGDTTPEADPHIYAEDDATIYRAILGEDDCILNVGSCFKATIISNNEIQISDGVMCIGGHIMRIPYGQHVSITITNGIGGQKRNDIIYAKFEKTSNIHNFSDAGGIGVKKGRNGSVATDPILSKEDLYKGGTIREFPLYRVKLDGINIVSVEPLFKNSEKEYMKKELNLEEFYKVDGFKCYKKGKMVYINFSLNTNVQVDINHVYPITSSPIPKELRPTYIALLNGFSCNGEWGNARAISCFVDLDGNIKFSTPIKQSFYKISGCWEVE